MSEMPRATSVVLSITATVTALQWAVPALPQLMQRSPAVLTKSEWWRLITPIFINRTDSAELILNLAALLAVGALAELCGGSRRWLVFYLVGGLIDESGGLAWRPTGDGFLRRRVRFVGRTGQLASVLLACACIGGVMLWRDDSRMVTLV